MSSVCFCTISQLIAGKQLRLFVVKIPELSRAVCFALLQSLPIHPHWRLHQAMYKTRCFEQPASEEVSGLAAKPAVTHQPWQLCHPELPSWF